MPARADSTPPRANALRSVPRRHLLLLVRPPLLDYLLLFSYCSTTTEFYTEHHPASSMARVLDQEKIGASPKGETGTFWEADRDVPFRSPGGCVPLWRSKRSLFLQKPDS